MKLFTPVALSISLLVCSPSHSSEWSGTGEAGLIKASGNTDSSSANIGVSLNNQGELWSHELSAKLYRAENNKVTDANTSSLDYVAKRDLNERAYLFASASYLDDDFDGFTEQLSAGFGAGYRVYVSDQRDWDISLGLGYRDTSESILLSDGSRIEGKDLSSGIAILRSKYRQVITENTEFIDTFKAEIGSKNTFVVNDAYLTVAMNKKFSLKAGVLIRHNTDPAPGADETDTITSVNLVYNFVGK